MTVNQAETAPENQDGEREGESATIEPNHEAGNDAGDTADNTQSGASNGGVDPAGEEEDLVLALEEARGRIKEMEEGHLRAQAEVENIRRRSQKEIVSARKYAVEGFARELLAVKDSLDQAAHVQLGEGESEAVVRMQEGLELTLKQLETVLEKFDVVEVEAGPGVKFNPDQHQAISMVASGEVPSDHIIDVMQKGFLLKDRLLRPAMVVVAS